MDPTEEVPAHIRHAKEFLEKLDGRLGPTDLWFIPDTDGEPDCWIDSLQVRQAYEETEMELPDCNTMVLIIESFDKAQGGGYSTYQEISHYLVHPLGAKFRTGSGFIQMAYAKVLATTLETLVPIPL